MELWGRAVGTDWRRAMEGQFEIYMGNGCEQIVEEWRQKVVARMFSLSEFMKLVKQRFTQWYNGSHGRTGTLWESRFTSVIVEDEERALRTMAAYIDLNPVRAGMVEDPADYRWCGYAEAMAGSDRARAGIERVTFCNDLDRPWKLASGKVTLDAWEKENEVRKAEVERAEVGMKNDEQEKTEETKVPAGEVTAAEVQAYQKRGVCGLWYCTDRCWVCREGNGQT